MVKPATNKIEASEHNGTPGPRLASSQAPDALKREQSLLHTLITNTEDLIYIKDKDSRFLLANVATAKHMRVSSPEELLGKTDYDFFPKELSDIFFNDEQKIVRTGQPLINSEEPAIDPQGRPRFFSTTKVPLRNDEGQIIGIIGIGRDITDRKRAQLELEEYKKHLEDLVGQRTSQLALANKQLSLDQQKLTRTNEELSRDRKVIMQMVTDLEEANHNLKLAQSRLVQSEKMASLGQLAAGVAHEINNPMAYIISNLSVLSSYADTIENVLRLYTSLEESMRSIPDIQELEEYQMIEEYKERSNFEEVLWDLRRLIEETNQGAERVKKIVLDLKTFSRTDKETPEEANINEIVSLAISIAWNELRYNVTLHKQFSDVPLIRCYPRQLEQVFINLLVNASQSIVEKGTITVKTYQEDRDVLVEIADTGIGIREDDISKIFEPFFTTKDVGKGTGLGLSIAYGIIQKHNGDISVKSKLQEGTTFTIRLPIDLDRHS